MKADIHPTYEMTTITCACGEVMHIPSTRKNVRIEICSQCHPFYTGKHRLVDTAGRVEKFQKKYGDGKSLDTKKQAPKPGDQEAPRASEASSGTIKLDSDQAS